MSVIHHITHARRHLTAVVPLVENQEGSIMEDPLKEAALAAAAASAEEMASVNAISFDASVISDKFVSTAPGLRKGGIPQIQNMTGVVA